MMMMKNLNGSSKEGAGVNYKEGMKLLDIESSDSDAQEHFSLPPLELKGARKKKMRMKNSSDADSCCNCWKALAIFLLLIAVLSIAVIGYFTYRLHQEVGVYRTRLESMSSSSNGNQNDLEKLVNDVKDIRGRIQTVEKIVENHKTNITNMFNQIKSLNATASHLKASVADSTELINLPTSVKNLAQELATVGSNLQSHITSAEDIKTMKADKADLEAFQEQLNQINGRVTSLQKDPGDREPSATSSEVIGLQNDISILHRKVDTLNDTMKKLSSLNSDRELHMDRLHNRTMALVGRVEDLEAASGTSYMDPSQIRLLISQQITNLTARMASGDRVNASELSAMQMHLSVLENKVTSHMEMADAIVNITHRIDSLTEQTEQKYEDLTRTMGLTTLHITELRNNVSAHGARLAELEAARMRQPATAPGDSTGTAVTDQKVPTHLGDDDGHNRTSSPIPLPPNSPVASNETLTTEWPGESRTKGEDDKTSETDMPSDTDARPPIEQGEDDTRESRRTVREEQEDLVNALGKSRQEQ